MGKILDRLENLNKISKNILKYGLGIVLIASIISSILIKRADSIATLNLAREFVSANVHTFCEVIIGAILFDMLIGKDQENDR